MMNTSEEPNMVKGVRASTPAPFLIKTHRMVDDSCTNSIISWNSSGTSFIIWDHLIFSKDILPQYFRHSNFSSFIYQLNNYGFRKIGLRQYEYENKWFQAGKQHWLINITRRNQYQSVTRERLTQKRSFDTETCQMKVDVQNLRSNVSMIKSELGSLKEKIQDFQSHVNHSEQQIRQTEIQTRKILEFLAETCSPSFVQKITQYVEVDEELKDDQVMEIRSKNAIQILEREEMEDQEMEVVANTENFDARIIWKKILEMREEGNEAELRVQADKQSKISDIELDNLMGSKMVLEVDDAMEDEVVFDLWTRTEPGLFS